MDTVVIAVIAFILGGFVMFVIYGTWAAKRFDKYELDKRRADRTKRQALRAASEWKDVAVRQSAKLERRRKRDMDNDIFRK